MLLDGETAEAFILTCHLRSTCGKTCGHLRGLQAYKLQATHPLPPPAAQPESRYPCKASGTIDLCVWFSMFFYRTRLRGANPQPVGYEFRSQ